MDFLFYIGTDRSCPKPFLFCEWVSICKYEPRFKMLCEFHDAYFHRPVSVGSVYVNTCVSVVVCVCVCWAHVNYISINGSPNSACQNDRAV